MFKTFQSLPKGYHRLLTIDMKNNKRDFWIMNGLSVLLMLISLIPLFFIEFTFEYDLLRYFCFILFTIVYIVLHELVHAIFFKLGNKYKVKFQFHGFAASASVPGVLYQKIHFLIITIAPFVVFSFVLLPLLILIGDYWFFVLYLILVVHVSGCAGDFYVFYRLLSMPKKILVEDRGIVMNVYSILNEDGKY